MAAHADDYDGDANDMSMEMLNTIMMPVADTYQTVVDQLHICEQTLSFPGLQVSSLVKTEIVCLWWRLPHTHIHTGHLDHLAC